MPWLIDLLIQLVLLAIFTTIVVWVINYLAQPWSPLAVKVVGLIAVLCFLLIMASFLTGWDWWPRMSRPMLR